MSTSAVPDTLLAAPHPRTYEVRTFGCQMNVLDSQLVEGQTFSLNDGVVNMVFEFSTDAVVSGTNVRVPFLASDRDDQIAVKKLEILLFQQKDYAAGYRWAGELVDGPFRRLGGEWTFIALREDACKVQLHLHYDFAPGLLGRAIAPVFDGISASMIDSFTRRADWKVGETAGCQPALRGRDSWGFPEGDRVRGPGTVAAEVSRL